MILSAALAGMKEKLSPGGAISGDDHAVSHEPLPTNWDYALQRFAPPGTAPLAPAAGSLVTILLPMRRGR